MSVSDVDDSVVWGVDSSRQIFKRENDSWQKVEGALKMISCGQSGVWGVDFANQIFYRTGTYGGANRLNICHVTLTISFEL